MSWLVLIISGALEAVWATALDRSEGFRHPLPVVIFLAALTASMLGLAYSLRALPVGTAYAVWVGIGATLTVVTAMATGAETFSVGKVLCMLAIVSGVVGLRLLP